MSKLLKAYRALDFTGRVKNCELSNSASRISPRSGDMHL